MSWLQKRLLSCLRWTLRFCKGTSTQLRLFCSAASGVTWLLARSASNASCSNVFSQVFLALVVWSLILRRTKAPSCPENSKGPKRIIYSLHRSLQVWFCELSCLALQPGSCKTVLNLSAELNLVSSSYLPGSVSTVGTSSNSSLRVYTRSSLMHRRTYSK